VDVRHEQPLYGQDDLTVVVVGGLTTHEQGRVVVVTLGPHGASRGVAHRIKGHAINPLAVTVVDAGHGAGVEIVVVAARQRGKTIVEIQIYLILAKAVIKLTLENILTSRFLG